VQFGQAAVRITAAVEGVDLIELVARSAGPRDQSFPVVWGNAALTK